MSAYATQEDADKPSTEEVYEAVLRTVDYQTSPKQLPGVRRPVVVRTLSPPCGHYDFDRVDSAFKAARQNKDILAWTDADGRRRFTLAEVDDLRSVAEWAFKHDPRLTGVVSWANRQVEEVKDGA